MAVIFVGCGSGDSNEILIVAYCLTALNQQKNAGELDDEERRLIDHDVFTYCGLAAVAGCGLDGKCKGDDPLPFTFVY